MEHSATPALSVVIACRDGEGTLELQLRALSRQHSAPPFEVVVVDNGSTVSLAPLVHRWTTHLDVRLVQADAHRGTSYARNVGVAAAAAEMIAFCDADDCVGPGFVRAAHEALQTAEVATGDGVPLDADAFTGGLAAVWGALAAARPAPGPPVADGVDHGYPILLGGACAVRRATFEQLGGFDQAFFPGAEDNDLALRTLASGRSIALAPGMQLAERRRATPYGAWRRSYAAGRMHVRLCSVHHLWRVSPHLHAPEWWLDLAKMPLVLLKASASDARVRREAASRAGLRLGQAAGMIRFRLARRGLRPQLALGLEGRVSSQ